MKKPKIVELNQGERDALIKRVGDSNLDDSSKGEILNTIDFAIELQRQLQDSKISIATLKRLFGSDSETLKKLLQTF